MTLYPLNLTVCICLITLSFPNKARAAFLFNLQVLLHERKEVHRYVNCKFYFGFQTRRAETDKNGFSSLTDVLILT